MTLREILVFQSFFISKTNSEILNLVKIQPNPSIFFKSFLEFDCLNMGSILAFDTKSMEWILKDDNEEYFSSEFPIIYKNKIKKMSGLGYYYQSAIDSAIKSNQIKAVNVMIDYIVKFQNTYVSSYLFLKLMPTLVEKGIPVFGLLNSQIFECTFDYDEWPGNHQNDLEEIRPYNFSFFQLNHHYKTVFPEEDFEK